MLTSRESDHFVTDWLLGRFEPAIRSAPKSEPALLHEGLRLASPRHLVLRPSNLEDWDARGLCELLAKARLRPVAFSEDLTNP
jgi:hypothetical protein